MEEQKAYYDVGSVIIETPPPTIEVRVPTAAPDPPVKPPRPPFIDRNLEAGKVVFREAIREVVVECVKWLLSGRKRQPAQA